MKISTISFVLLIVWTGTIATQMSLLPYSTVLVAPSTLTMYWDFSSDLSTITIQMVLEGEGWIGICFHNGTDQDMDNGDFWTGSIETNGTEIVDRWGPQNGVKPNPDYQNATCQEDVITGSFYQVPGNGTTYSVFLFQRLVDTKDLCDCPIVNATQYLAYAYGNNGQSYFSAHGPNAASFQMNFFEVLSNNGSTTVVASKDYTTWKILHGTLMFFAFGFCMSLGVFLPRYLKQFWWWFPLHIIIMVTGVITSIVAFIIALIMVNGNQFSTIHAWFGLFTLLVAFISPFLGTASHFMWKPSRSRIPIFPDVLHWWVARFTILLSYVTIFLGMYSFGVPGPLFFGFFIVVATYAFFYIFLDISNIKEIGISQYFSLSTKPHTPGGGFDSLE